VMVQIQVLWALAAARVKLLSNPGEEGSVVEKVILTAIFAALAIAVGAIIVSKITAKANSIDLN